MIDRLPYDERGAGAMSSQSLDDEPLGPDDASRRDDLRQSFVNVGDIIPGVSGTAASLLGKSVIIGAKGAGKTHMLRHVEALAKEQRRHVVFCNLNQDIVADIRHLRGTLSFEESVTLWMNVWRLVINRSLLGVFLGNSAGPKGRRAIERSDLIEASCKEDKSERERLRAHFASHYPALGVADLRSADPMSSLISVVGRYRSGASLSSALSSFDFANLEADIAALLRGFGEVHYLIDGLDEFAPSNPRDWLDMQIGLFKLLFLWSATRDYLRRVYITITLRAYVFHHAMRDTHADRVGNLVLPLTWTPNTAEEFLNRRLTGAPLKGFAYSERMTGERPLANWLGFDTITPVGRSESEPVERYLLRHSRYSPRNVVHAVNKLCQTQNRLFLKGQSLDEDHLRAAVRLLAMYFGENLLRHVTEELMSIIPVRARNLRDAAHREAAREFRLETVKDAFVECLRECRTETCERELLEHSILISIVPLLAGYNEQEVLRAVESVLWRSGVIAYADENFQSGWRFAWSEGEAAHGRILPAARRIGFHSSMIDVCGIGATADGPVF